MYWIFVEKEFQASHQLTFADGTQESAHTHLWRVTAAVYAPSLNREGLVMDFCDLEKSMKTAISSLENKKIEGICLNLLNCISL